MAVSHKRSSTRVPFSGSFPGSYVHWSSVVLTSDLFLLFSPPAGTPFFLHFPNHCFPLIAWITINMIPAKIHPPSDDRPMELVVILAVGRIFPSRVFNWSTKSCKSIFSIFSNNFGSLLRVTFSGDVIMGFHEVVHRPDETFERARKEPLNSNFSSAW